MMTRNGRCSNFNHGRPNAPALYCPMCGEVVNSQISQKICSKEKNTKSRRERTAYCVDCGEQLIQGKRPPSGWFAGKRLWINFWMGDGKNLNSESGASSGRTTANVFAS